MYLVFALYDIGTFIIPIYKKCVDILYFLYSIIVLFELINIGAIWYRYIHFSEYLFIYKCLPIFKSNIL